ncbi:MAG TPA: hypothetical protein VHK70_08265, partial [Burkholderiaceae bacterium]|nr:hypothetical protein [Burkholderiaceae bacterium]
ILSVGKACFFSSSAGNATFLLYALSVQYVLQRNSRFSNCGSRAALLYSLILHLLRTVLS